MHDLVIRGGAVVDPANGIHGTADVAIDAGRVRAVERHIAGKGKREIDAAGLIVTPGLVDVHIHAYKGVSHYGIDPDETCLATGVTTAVDAGTAGWCTWPGLKLFVLRPSRMRLRALINISGMGMLSDYIGENHDLRWLDAATTATVAAADPDLICGVKVRLDVNRVGPSGIEPLRRAEDAGQRLAAPLMAHVGKTPDPLTEVARLMRPGDVITHCFHDWPHSILDDNGRVLPELRRAADQGLVFDVGHGAGSFSFRVAEAALDQGFLPGTISTDLHTYSLRGPVYDLPTLMTKFLHMGMSLDEVVSRTTVNAAAVFGLGNEAGALTPGHPADVTLLQEIEGRFRLDDSFGNYRIAQRALVPRRVVLGGEVLPARSNAPWR